MSTYTVRGTYQSREGWRNYEKDVEAENENVAREHTYALFGSQHGLKRTQLTVEEVEA